MSAVFGKTGHKKKYIEKDKDFGKILSDLREKNINRPIIGLLNINSISFISLNLRPIST